MRKKKGGGNEGRKQDGSDRMRMDIGVRKAMKRTERERERKTLGEKEERGNKERRKENWDEEEDSRVTCGTEWQEKSGKRERTKRAS